MNRRQLGAHAELALRELGVDRPLDIEQLRNALAQRRGRPLDLVPTDDLPPHSAFAFTGSTDSLDVVMYDARLVGLHRNLVILHEFSHMILDHSPSVVDHSYRAPRMEEFQAISAETLAEVLGTRPPRPIRTRRARRRPERSLYDDPMEWEAETMATILLSWMPGGSRPRRATPEDPFEEMLSSATPRGGEGPGPGRIAEADR